MATGSKLCKQASEAELRAIVRPKDLGAEESEMLNIHCEVGVTVDDKIEDLKKWTMEENATRQTHRNNCTGGMVVSKEMKLP